MIHFRDPWWLLLLLVIPLIVLNYVRSGAGGTIKFSSIEPLKRIRRSGSLTARHVLLVLRCAAVAALACALARPQQGREDTRVVTEGIDLMLTVDTSGSMLAEDLARGQSRLDVVREVVKHFIGQRKNDRIGLVVYGEDAYTQCPLTLDYGVLRDFMDKTKIGMAGPNRTAIGDALAASIARLKDSKGKSKVIILLTDGQNNSGKIAPMTAVELAEVYKIKVYTIGAGTRGVAPFPTTDFFGRKVYQSMQVDIDEELLQNVANVTSGRYFRATDSASLKRIYDDIDTMEKTKTETFHYMEWNERFTRYALAGGILLLVELVLANTRFRKLP